MRREETTGSSVAEFEKTGRGKTALALGGGGVRGVAHLGVMKFLEENHHDRYDFVVGTSAGALFGALYLLSLDADEAQDTLSQAVARLSKTKGLPVVASRKSKFLTNVQEKLQTAKSLLTISIIDKEPLREFITALVGENTTFSDLKKPLYVVATDLKSGKDVVFSRGELVPALIASSALPGVFPPIEYHSYYLIDGGITQKLPSRIAYGLGAKRVFAVDVGSPFRFKDRFATPLQVIMRSEEIASQALHDRNCDTVNLLLSPRFGEMRWYEFKRHHEAFEAGHSEASENSRRIHRFFQPSLGRPLSTLKAIEKEFILE